MKAYKTIAAKTETREPRQTRNMTAKEIVAYCMQHFNFDPETMTAKNKVTAYMREVMSAVQDPSNWKNPFYAEVPSIRTEWIIAAAEWFHGAVAVNTCGGVYSPGYQCW